MALVFNLSAHNKSFSPTILALFSLKFTLPLESIIDSGLGDTDPDFGKLGLDTAEEEASETVKDVDDEGGEDNA